MFIKRTTRAGNAYAYRMLLSFKMSLTYKKKLTSCRTTASIVKLLSLDMTRFFAVHCSMSGANIQVQKTEKTELILAQLFQLVETGFLVGGKHLCSLSQIFFKDFFILVSRNTFFSPKEKILFFIQSFLSCQWKLLFELQRSLFKTLITAIGNHFL